jgi:hypothetical protein
VRTREKNWAGARFLGDDKIIVKQIKIVFFTQKQNPYQWHNRGMKIHKAKDKSK